MKIHKLLIVLFILSLVTFAVSQEPRHQSPYTGDEIDQGIGISLDIYNNAGIPESGYS